MTFDWYKLFNMTEWVAAGLVAQTLVVNLEGKGRTTFEITQGNTTAVRFDDVFLPVGFQENNPYARDSYAVYLDENNDVWFGFEVDA